MTLTATWVRTVGTTHELVFASDSRLSGGETWDRCPKIFKLPRTDALMAFSGYTWYAFPLVLQLQNAIASHGPSSNRSSDLAKAKGHALRIFNEMYSDLRDLPGAQVPGDPEAQFVLGGWSWRDNRYRIWFLDWSDEARAFVFRTVRSWKSFPNVTVWFDGSKDVVRDVRAALDRLLRDRPKDGRVLDLEPLHLLTAAIRSGAYRDVGGAPQLAKVYRSLNAEFSVCGWSAATGDTSTRFLTGRPLLQYERVGYPITTNTELEPQQLSLAYWRTCNARATTERTHEAEAPKGQRHRQQVRDASSDRSVEGRPVDHE